MYALILDANPRMPWKLLAKILCLYLALVVTARGKWILHSFILKMVPYSTALRHFHTVFVPENAEEILGNSYSNFLQFFIPLKNPCLDVEDFVRTRGNFDFGVHDACRELLPWKHHAFNAENYY